MNKLDYLCVIFGVMIFVGGCYLITGLQTGTPGHYGLNEDGSCDEECKKVYWEEGNEDMAYCDCN